MESAFAQVARSSHQESWTHPKTSLCDCRLQKLDESSVRLSCKHKAKLELTNEIGGYSFLALQYYIKNK